MWLQGEVANNKMSVKKKKKESHRVVGIIWLTCSELWARFWGQRHLDSKPPPIPLLWDSSQITSSLCLSCRIYKMGQIKHLSISGELSESLTTQHWNDAWCIRSVQELLTVWLLKEQIQPKPLHSYCYFYLSHHKDSSELWDLIFKIQLMYLVLRDQSHTECRWSIPENFLAIGHIRGSLKVPVVLLDTMSTCQFRDWCYRTFSRFFVKGWCRGLSEKRNRDEHKSARRETQPQGLWWTSHLFYECSMSRDHHLGLL